MKVCAAESVEAVAIEADGVKAITKRVLIGNEDGATNFRMRMFTVGPGGYTPRHTHDWEHEVFIASGAGTAWSAAGETPIGPGDVVFVPANEEHQFLNAGQEDFKFLCLVPSHATA